MSTVGVILSTVGDTQYRGRYHDACGGYHEYRGVFSTVGDIMIHVGDIMSTVGVFSTIGYSNNKRSFPHGTEHPDSTHDIPHMHHDILHGTEYPWYSR